MNKQTLTIKLEEIIALAARMEAEASTMDAQIQQIQQAFAALQVRYNQTIGKRDVLKQLIADAEAEEAAETEPSIPLNKEVAE